MHPPRSCSTKSDEAVEGGRHPPSNARDLGSGRHGRARAGRLAGDARPGDVSMLVQDELSRSASVRAKGTGAHGIQTEGPKPQLHHVQAVLDRLAPEPTMAQNMRWSSVFRISHRLVNRYRHGRVFLAGGHRPHPSPHGPPRHEHRNPGRVQPWLENRARGSWRCCAGLARQLSRRTPSGRGGGGRQDHPRRTGGASVPATTSRLRC
jgi:hypothetical protein